MVCRNVYLTVTLILYSRVFTRKKQLKYFIIWSADFDGEKRNGKPTHLLDAALRLWNWSFCGIDGKVLFLSLYEF